MDVILLERVQKLGQMGEIGTSGDYATFVETRIEDLARSAKRDLREQPREVRREWALLEIAALVNRNAPLAVRGTRLAIRQGLDLPLREAENLGEAFRERVLRTEDSKEGPLAFVEKREPNWKAR